jgi:hypothetical protein
MHRKSNESPDQLGFKKTYHLLVHADDDNLRLMDQNRNTIDKLDLSLYLTN